jgi:hypothetical protein
VIVTSNPEPQFAARVEPPDPPRPLPSARCAIFFDVENTSRPEYVARVLDHLSPDWSRRAIELVAVGNWRVIGNDTARLLAGRGAHLVHSAPSSGVRDWSDLRIAVAAGAWLAAARPGDAIEIVSDDHAFDAVGDVAASLGVAFRRVSYRVLAGLGAELPAESRPAESRSRRRRRGGRRGRREGPPREVVPVHATPPPAANGAEPHGAPEEVIVGIVEDLLAASPAGVTLDALSNTLKTRGFSRPPGSLRLITRLRRMKALEVTRDNIVRLAPEGAAEAMSEAGWPVDAHAGGAAAEGEPVQAGGTEPPVAAPEGGRRRRRRRGGRRRRGRGRGGSGASQAAVSTS